MGELRRSCMGHHCPWGSEPGQRAGAAASGGRRGATVAGSEPLDTICIILLLWNSIRIAIVLAPCRNNVTVVPLKLYWEYLQSVAQIIC